MLLESPNSSMTNDESQVTYSKPVVTASSEPTVQQSDVDKLLAFSPQGDQGTTATNTSNEVHEEIFIDLKPPADTNVSVVPSVRQCCCALNANNSEAIFIWNGRFLCNCMV